MGLLQVIMAAVAVDDMTFVSESSDSCPILLGYTHDDDERLNVSMDSTTFAICTDYYISRLLPEVFGRSFFCPLHTCLSRAFTSHDTPTITHYEFHGSSCPSPLPQVCD